MFVKVGVFLVVVVVSVALAFPYAPPAPQYQTQPGMPYGFGFRVYDKYSGQNFGQQEQSDGNVVVGSYTVDLPDGRQQTVNYEADKYRGYVADVSYTGQAYQPHY